jgi:hypothetical protein
MHRVQETFLRITDNGPVISYTTRIFVLANGGSVRGKW